ncbi:Candidapepsin-1 [Candida viswanathii]|uniref:candidapepsin n=1 Tax=Candida viswanathii TaxID=5486 RepID=A0A367YMT1_9ASCO|nr:Candidapepsin-1 [Candida viswanathii]
MFLKHTFVVLAFALLAQAVPTKRSPGFVSLDFNIVKTQKNVTFEGDASTLTKRDAVPVTLINEEIKYAVDITVGSDKQKQTVVIDTGSSDLWVVDPRATCIVTTKGQADDFCKQTGTYFPDSSSTANYLGTAFGTRYGDHSSAAGMWYTDTIGIGGVDIKDQRFGDVTTTSIAQGILGVGYKSNEAFAVYDNVPLSLKNQGIISKTAYSLYLNSPDSKSGTIIFGGIDHAKYSGELITVPLTTGGEFRIHLNSLTIDGATVPAALEGFLDSGSTYTHLQNSVFQQVSNKYNATYGPGPDGSNVYLVDCDLPGSIDFNFDNSAKISVPATEFAAALYNDDGEKFPKCQLSLVPGDVNILGDNFLRSAYVVYDLDDNEISLAQVKYTNDTDIAAIV